MHSLRNSRLKVKKTISSELCVNESSTSFYRIPRHCDSEADFKHVWTFRSRYREIRVRCYRCECYNAVKEHPRRVARRKVGHPCE